MTSFSHARNLRILVENLRLIDPGMAEKAEIEELILYPHVARRIQRYGLKYASAHDPSRVPREQI